MGVCVCAHMHVPHRQTAVCEERQNVFRMEVVAH